jgi:hypothetical protein
LLSAIYPDKITKPQLPFNLFLNFLALRHGRGVALNSLFLLLLTKFKLL